MFYLCCFVIPPPDESRINSSFSCICETCSSVPVFYSISLASIYPPFMHFSLLWPTCLFRTYFKDIFQDPNFARITLYHNLHEHFSDRTFHSIQNSMSSLSLFEATLKHVIYCSPNLHRAYIDQRTERLLRSKMHVKVKKLTTLLYFEDHTPDFQHYKVCPRPR